MSYFLLQICVADRFAFLSFMDMQITEPVLGTEILDRHGVDGLRLFSRGFIEAGQLLRPFIKESAFSVCQHRISPDCCRIVCHGAWELNSVELSTTW